MSPVLFGYLDLLILLQPFKLSLQNLKFRCSSVKDFKIAIKQIKVLVSEFIQCEHGNSFDGHWAVLETKLLLGLLPGLLLIKSLHLTRWSFSRFECNCPLATSQRLVSNDLVVIWIALCDSYACVEIPWFFAWFIGRNTVWSETEWNPLLKICIVVLRLNGQNGFSIYSFGPFRSAFPKFGVLT